MVPQTRGAGRVRRDRRRAGRADRVGTGQSHLGLTIGDSATVADPDHPDVGRTAHDDHRDNGTDDDRTDHDHHDHHDDNNRANDHHHDNDDDYYYHHHDHHVADNQRQHQHGDRDDHRPGGFAVTRIAYAHDAVVKLNEGGDSAAPGGAITVALCGHWDHEPPCPMAPHYTDAVPAGDGTLRLRVLFASDDEARIRALIGGALSSGRLTGPDGRVTTWTVRSSTAGTVRPDEADHAARLASS